MVRTLTIVLLAVLAAEAQDYGARLATVQRGGRVSFEPTGPGVLFDALDPALRKWYVPQELYAEYQWKQWEYSNYARRNYQRYVSTSLEGDYWYDAYGNLLTRGWLVYDWRQQNSAPFGSVVEKTGRFSGWFSSLAVASDHKGQYHLAVTVGNRIRTTLTPMTFSKPEFNGLQWDFASDKHAMTLLMSRINEPESPGFLPEGRTSNTNLFGGRLESQIGDFLVVGGTFVNAHHSVTQLDGFGSDIISGVLSEGQNFRSVTSIQVRIADDSPGDGSGGALFSSDLLIHDFDGGSVSASGIGFRPIVEGGLQRPGYLAADGDEIVVTYDFDDRTYSGPDPTEIERVEVELVVANDYRIEIASDRQTNADGDVVFLPLTRARGNVRDGSNQRVLRFDYGVPTANQIARLTMETTDLRGLDAYLEVNVNHRYRKYPNPHRERHETARDRSLGWLLNVSRKDYPWFALVEAFGMDPGYSTSFVTVEARSSVPDYGNRFEIYEFVEDNDDYDRFPDWRRKGSPAGDEDVFPGLDENNDRIWDFNQNDNEERQSLIPDWEEPFLRYFADRPEYLYGVDSNHNGTVDRFENDERPDYPYRRDQQGYNLYGGAHLGPDVRLTLGPHGGGAALRRPPQPGPLRTARRRLGHGRPGPAPSLPGPAQGAGHDPGRPAAVGAAAQRPGGSLRRDRPAGGAGHLGEHDLGGMAAPAGLRAVPGQQGEVDVVAAGRRRPRPGAAGPAGVVLLPRRRQQGPLQLEPGPGRSSRPGGRASGRARPPWRGRSRAATS